MDDFELGHGVIVITEACKGSTFSHYINKPVINFQFRAVDGEMVNKKQKEPITWQCLLILTLRISKYVMKAAYIMRSSLTRWLEHWTCDQKIET